MKYYKLTDQNMQTYDCFQWKLKKKYSVSGIGELCSSGWFHVYNNPILAIILNPIHADFNKPRLFECVVSGKIKRDKGLKYGAQHCTMIKEIPLPILSTEYKIEFAIRCALKVYKNKSFAAWAKNWLSGKDRSSSAANTAANAVMLGAGYFTPLQGYMDIGNAISLSVAVSAAVSAAAYTTAAANIVAHATAYAVADARHSKIKFSLIKIIEEMKP
jgi:hypothetical protein